MALACGGGEAPERAARVVAFDTTRVAVVAGPDTLPLTVELAETEAQRAYGLMERDSLPEGRGMLFRYRTPQPPGAGFWMWRTRIALDIGFLDGEGRIVAIRSMEPCPSAEPRWCPSYAPGVGYQSALEVPAGWFDRHGVEVGDRVVDVRRRGAPGPDPVGE